ncbi:hypothetical protein Tco_0755483, partial [Tanacetum coccineum]
MAQRQQQIILADQLVTSKYQSIGRCNNYVVLQNISCSPECTIVGQILIDHALSYALTATADVPAVYLQHFWKTVSKHSIKDDIPLVSVYTTRNVTVRGMLIPEEFITSDIRATKEYKEYEKVFFGKRKRKHIAGETSSPKPSLRIRVKQFKTSKLVYLVIQVDDDDDSGNRIEPRSHKKHPKIVDDDDDNEKEKKDNDNDDDVNDDHTNHSLDKTQEI